MVPAEPECADGITLSRERRLRGISRDAFHGCVELRAYHALLSESLSVIDGRYGGGGAAVSRHRAESIQLSGQTDFLRRHRSHSRIGVLHRRAWEPHTTDAGCERCSAVDRSGDTAAVTKVRCVIGLRFLVPREWGESHYRFR